MIGGIGDFDRWGREYTQSGPTEEELRYVADLPPVPVGRWHIAEEFKRRQRIDPSTSIQYARSVQQFADVLPPADRLEELIGCQARLDMAAVDIRGHRVYLNMDDGGISGNVGGYAIFQNDDPTYALRIYEINHGSSMRAGIDSETGLRLAGPFFVPVLAVRSLALLAKH